MGDPHSTESPDACAVSPVESKSLIAMQPPFFCLQKYFLGIEHTELFFFVRDSFFQWLKWILRFNNYQIKDTVKVQLSRKIKKKENIVWCILQLTAYGKNQESAEFCEFQLEMSHHSIVDSSNYVKEISCYCFCIYMKVKTVDQT